MGRHPKVNRRQEYLKALRRQEAAALTWAPNFDHWHAVNLANGTVPPEYRGLAPNDIVRAVDATIWRRVSLLRTSYDGVQIDNKVQDQTSVWSFRTPVGELRSVYRQAPDSSKAWFLTEHPIRTVEDLRPMKYLIESTRYEPQWDACIAAQREVGDDGVVLTMALAVPFLQFAKIDVGYQNAFYLLADYPDRVQEVLDAYHRKYLEACRLMAQSPVEMVSTGDNMDQWTCPPDYFRRFAAPFYHEMAAVLHAGGKLAAGHWCGRVDQLVPLMADCGLDVIEAVTPRPMSNLEMPALMDAVEGKVAIQGGVPSVYMCHEGCTADHLVRYVADLLAHVGRRRGFILGMGDNVPPNAEFGRVRMISDLVARFNGL